MYCVLTVLAKDVAPLLTSFHNVPSCTLVFVGSTTFCCITEPSLDACSVDGLITVSFNVLPISCACKQNSKKFLIFHEIMYAHLLLHLICPRGSSR